MGFKAYQDVINLPLLWQMKDLIARVANEKKKDRSWEKTLFGVNKQLEMEEAYQLRYPGEVLERYKERCGDTPENMRALAIALAESRCLLEVNMFIGNQKQAFIRKIRSFAETDIYLYGALYVLTEKKTEKENIKERLLQYETAATQEFVYIQSVFLLEQPDYEANLEKWNYFFGVGRSIKAYDNESIYAWFLNLFSDKIKGYGRKGTGIIKSLMQLPIHAVNEGSSYWERLSEAGYSGQEILFLNMNLPFLSDDAERIKKDSITMERIVAQGCKKILNAEKVEDQRLFREVTKFLSIYRKFSICIGGAKDLTEYLQYEVQIKNVELFLYLYQREQDSLIDKRWFLVELPKERWDKLPFLLGEEQYLCLFEECFLHSGKGQEDKWLKKFEELCGHSYSSCLWKHDGKNTDQVFKWLVQTGNFKLVELLKQYIQEQELEGEQTAEEKWSVMLKHIKNAVEHICCQEVFRFWENYESVYGMRKLRQFLGNKDRISDVVNFEKHSYYYGNSKNLWSGLDFLSVGEQQKLFYWECDELYRHDPDNYNKFLKEFLLKECMHLFLKEECREIAETLMESISEESYEKKQLRELYYTQEELTAYEEEENRKKEENKKLSQQKKWEDWKNELSKGLNDENRICSRLAVIIKNVNSYYKEKTYFILLKNILKEEEDKGNWKIEGGKLPDFLKMMSILVDKEAAGWIEICRWVQELEVMEDEFAVN